MILFYLSIYLHTSIFYDIVYKILYIVNIFN